MDKFLDVIYLSQLEDTETADKFEEIFSPMLERLKELLSEKLFEEIEELFTDCCVENNRFYAIEGMKLAIDIMDGNYTTRV